MKKIVKFCTRLEFWELTTKVTNEKPQDTSTDKNTKRTPILKGKKQNFYFSVHRVNPLHNSKYCLELKRRKELVNKISSSQHKKNDGLPQGHYKDLSTLLTPRSSRPFLRKKIKERNRKQRPRKWNLIHLNASKSLSSNTATKRGI